MLQVGQTIYANDTLTVMQCGECGIHFAMPETFRQECKNTGQGWHCPNGHARVYGETEADRLRKQIEANAQHFMKQLEASQRKATNLEERASQLTGEKAAVQRQLSAAKGAITKVKRRVAKGYCPCCNRHFVDLHAHMDNKHPDYVQSDA